MRQTVESASLEYFNKNSKYRPEMEFAIRTAFEAGAEWQQRQSKTKAIMDVILLTEESWRNSPLSTARICGAVRVNGHVYSIVDKQGTDLFTLSAKAEKEGRDKAIEAGEPCDLVRNDFISYYKTLGRDRFIEVLKEHPYDNDKRLEKIFKELIKIKNQ